MLEEKILTRADVERIKLDYLALLEREMELARSEERSAAPQGYGGIWSDYSGGLEPNGTEISTALDVRQLARLLESQTHFPNDFHLHPKIFRAVALRREMASGKRPLDWAAAEALAFASLAIDGTRIRLSVRTRREARSANATPCCTTLKPADPTFRCNTLPSAKRRSKSINSPLSEAGVLGFEYGYSLDYPDALVAWEAQFGDFGTPRK